MKKILTVTVLAALLLGACEKEDKQTTIHEQTHNRVITLSRDGKTGNSTFLFALAIGHNGNDCKGCMTIDGHLVHINCMGNGDYCATSAAVQLQQNVKLNNYHNKQFLT